MLKFDNTCTEYPNMTRVLDEIFRRCWIMDAIQ